MGIVISLRRSHRFPTLQRVENIDNLPLVRYHFLKYKGSKVIFLQTSKHSGDDEKNNLLVIKEEEETNSRSDWEL